MLQASNTLGCFCNLSIRWELVHIICVWTWENILTWKHIGFYQCGDIFSGSQLPVLFYEVEHSKWLLLSLSSVVWGRTQLGKVKMIATILLEWCFVVLYYHFYCVKYHYLILTIAIRWRKQTSTTHLNIFKTNILVSALCIYELGVHHIPSSPL